MTKTTLTEGHTGRRRCLNLSPGPRFLGGGSSYFGWATSLKLDASTPVDPAVNNSAIMFLGLLHSTIDRRAKSPCLAAHPPNPPPRSLDFCESDCHFPQYQQPMSSSSCMYILITLSCSLDAAPRASMGWGDVSFHGSTQIPTPNIDVLAGDGVILNNYYVLPTCTPSRAALMTGLYPIHTGMQSDIIEPAAPWGLPLENKILPQHFRDLGYDVNMIGKWHLGFFKTPYVPIKRGFDTFFGFYTGSNDYYNHTSGSENNEQVQYSI
ncbi:putative arylsulfatase B precursor [Ixodes scapularis]